jgi:hypothetical protein
MSDPFDSKDFLDDSTPDIESTVKEEWPVFGGTVHANAVSILQEDIESHGRRTLSNLRVMLELCGQPYQNGDDSSITLYGISPDGNHYVFVNEFGNGESNMLVALDNDGRFLDRSDEFVQETRRQARTDGQMSGLLGMNRYNFELLGRRWGEAIRAKSMNVQLHNALLLLLMESGRLGSDAPYDMSVDSGNPDAIAFRNTVSGREVFYAIFDHRTLNLISDTTNPLYIAAKYRFEHPKQFRHPTITASDVEESDK